MAAAGKRRAAPLGPDWTETRRGCRQFRVVPAYFGRGNRSCPRPAAETVRSSRDSHSWPHIDEHVNIAPRRALILADPLFIFASVWLIVILLFQMQLSESSSDPKPHSGVPLP